MTTSAVEATPEQKDDPSALDYQIGALLRRLRVGLHLTLPEAAALCGGSFSARTLRGWERGRTPIKIGTLNTILRAYGANTAWFMGEAMLLSRRAAPPSTGASLQTAAT